MANITSVNELWGRKWRFKDNTPSPSEFSLRNSVTGVKFATFYLGEQVKDVYQSGSNVGNVGITTQGTFIRIGVSASSFTYAYAASGWVGKPAILEFVDNTENYTLSCTNEENFITWFNENASEYVPPLNEWAEGIANKVRKLTGKTDKFKLLNLEKELDNISTGIDTSDATATPNDMLLGKTAYVDGKKIEGTIETWNGETNSDVNVENVVSVNGLIEEYKVYAGENISAGDFVDFINNVNKQLAGISGDSVSCILLEQNKVFIAYGKSYLYGVIVDIDGLTMTFTSTQLNNTAGICAESGSVLLENNKVLIIHRNSSSYLYGTIVEINGTTMTATTTTIDNAKKTYEFSCILLEQNKVFVAYSYDTNSYLYGLIINISGTTMTLTPTQLNSSSKSCNIGVDCVLLEPNKVFIAHAYGSSYYLYGTIVEINGNEMSSLATTKLNNSSSSYQSYYIHGSCILLEPNKVFIAAMNRSGTDTHLYGTIVEINGTTMTATNTQLSSRYVYAYNDCVLLEPNKVFIAHAYDSSNYYLYGTIVDIDGTTMTPTINEINSTKNIGYYGGGCVLLEPDKVFIAHVFYGSNYYLYGTIYFGNKAKQPTETASGKTIKGIAKTSGTGGETIQVFVPNTGV